MLMQLQLINNIRMAHPNDTGKLWYQWCVIGLHQQNYLLLSDFMLHVMLQKFVIILHTSWRLVHI